MVKIYCKNINRDDADKHISTKNHEELDDLPRKSVGQQVEAFLLAGQNLELSRRAFFELEDIPNDADVEDYDTGLDEYSDLHDFSEVQKDLSEKYKKVYALRREQLLNKKETTKEESKEETKEKDSAAAS